MKTRNKNKTKKEQEQEQTESLKDKGNRLYASGQYQKALEAFSQAIEQIEHTISDSTVPGSPVYNSDLAQLHLCYSNRSATYNVMKMYKESLKDAEKVIELKPDWAKGYLRAGQAHEQLLDYVLANEYYEQGLKLDAEDPTIKQAIENLRHILDELRITEHQLSSQPNPERDKFQHMIDWLKQGGAQFPRLYLQYYSEDYRGVHTLSTIPPDEIILFVPFNMIMTSEVAKEAGIGKQIVDARIELRSKHSYLASYLLQEKRKGAQSMWYPYIRCLPQLYNNMPIFFSQELLSLLQGSFTLEKIRDRQESLKAEYDNICMHVPDMLQYAYEEFVWARLVVITRIFGLVIRGVKTDGLVAYADMLNHKKPKDIHDTDTRWTFDDALNGFTITSLRKIQRAEEVHDSYGRKCNSRFFVNYGFSLDNNEDDNEAVLRFSLPPNDPQLMMKQRIAHGRNLLLPKEFQVPATYRETSDREKKTKEMFSYLRFIHAVDNELMVLSGGDEFKLEDIEPISCRLEIAVLKHVERSAQEALDQFPNTLEDDDRLMAENKFENSNVRNCVVMRRGEKQVLNWYLQLARACIPLLQMQWKDLKRCQSKFSSNSALDHYVTTVVAPLVKRGT